MKIRYTAAGLCLLGLVALGASPRYLEELRIGGGVGEPVDGGADFDRAGNITTDGAIACQGLRASGGTLEAGADAAARGMVTAWGGGPSAPGCLRLGAADGTPWYVFAADGGAGLRIHDRLPVSGADGQWLKARTVEDLSAPPAIGALAPNTGRFSAADVVTNLAVGGKQLLGATGTPPDARLHVFSGDSGFQGTRNARVSQGILLENSGDAVLELQAGANAYSELWFGDPAAEGVGRVRYEHSTDTLHFYALNASRMSVSSTGHVECGRLTAKSGEMYAGVPGTARGVLTAFSGSSHAPGVVRLVSADAVEYFLYVADDGTLRLGETLPGADAEGAVVGTQTRPVFQAFPADDTAPSVSGGSWFRVPDSWTAGHNITELRYGRTGQQIGILGGDSDCEVVDGTQLKLAGNWVAAPGRTLTLVFDGACWHELARSSN